MNRITSRRLAAAIMLAAALGACSSEGSVARSSGSTVRITGFLFKPETLAVSAGTTVTWTNGDDIAHTVTSGVPGAPAGGFDSGDRTKGQAFSSTFSTPGTFPYFCRNHNGMRGEVKVT